MIRILRLLVPASVLAMFVCEAALLTASYVAGVYLDTELEPPDFLFAAYGWLSVALAVGLILLGMHFRQLYSELRITSRILLLQELCLALGAMFVIEALLTYFRSTLALPRRVLLPGSGLALAALYVWRLLFAPAVRNRLGLERVLFLGFSPAAAQIADFLEVHNDVGFSPVGYLDTAQIRTSTKLARLGSPWELDDVVERCRPQCIVLDERTGITASQVDDLIGLRFSGVRVEGLESFYEMTTGRANAAGVRAAEFSFPEDLLPNPRNVKVQSILATLVTLFAMPVAIPLMGAIALALWVSSRGPVLVRETRVGLGGAPFTVRCFRSAPQGTRLHRFLGRFGLYQLPQVWNVLRGEMSLVGPEADRPEFADRLNRIIPFHAWRLSIQPGLIGWAQTHGRTRGAPRDAIRRLEYDLYYIKHLSPLLDLFVALQWIRGLLPLNNQD